MEISQWEEPDFFLEIDFFGSISLDFLHELNIKTRGKSMQLPYANEAKF